MESSGQSAMKHLLRATVVLGSVLTCLLVFQNCSVAENGINLTSSAGADSSGGDGSGVTPTPTPASGSSAWPDVSNTGIPAGTVLSTYSGPCTITTANTVIDAKTINCSLNIRAANVTIKRSKVNGTIDSGDDRTTGYSFRVEDSEIDATPGFAAAATAVGSVHFVVLRSHIYGGNRGANCWYDCLIQDSYFHGQDTDVSGTWHESGIRMGEQAKIIHNTILCDAPDVPPDAGCSASLTGYGDFGPVQNNLIQGNFFKATTGGFCSYGGSSGGKPYSNAANNIVFKDNVFEYGPGGKCGFWGPITDFNPSAPGNQWVNNRWEDGVIINP